MFKLLRRLVTLAIVLAIAAVVGVFFLDGVLTKGIEKGGTYALGVPVTAGSASVGLRSGDVTIGDLRIANPPGFGAEPFFAMKSLRAQIPVRQLLDAKVEIPNVTLSGLRVSLEQGLTGSNWSVITGNLKRFQTGGKNPEEAGGKRFVIKELVIEDVRVAAALVPIPGGALRQDVPIPSLRLRDVGAEGGQGALIGDLAAIVVQSVLGAVAANGGGVLPAATIADLSGQVRGLADAGVGGAKLNEAIKELQKNPAKALEGLGGLLGGKTK